MLCINDLFQQSIIQIGIKNAVKIIIIKPKPSKPKKQLILIGLNQSLVWTNWKYVTVGSKKKSIKQQKFNINNEANKPKFLINI